ncbi:hypothetical protein BAUCODRAFT_144880 [Baudoinia panamericana UAMH 10762]|uniref:Uncharacterized protein n=1 Tax=Baudoinia panamericana (strain UAMH 10762) TaxID=717646 RepID=M2MRK6_BAUPA|nr:uncharacterized protein BAUCODRAFT_144880 [Baudoinia panamericana UAMH 10762]EMC99461.1 hypothetical protein BAUCODRAFT_144880 [Baudoinia panamericana UAMH 10762]
MSPPTTDSRLLGRIAVITGASSGLGKATAIRFANSGARIICADLKSAGVEDEISKQHGKDSATFVSCDVTDESQIEDLVKQAVKWGGRLDIICNYAGVAVETSHAMQTRCDSLPTKDFDWAMSINCRGVWLCCKYALKQMLAQEPREPNARGERTRGWIVNAASMAGLIALNNTPVYTASKFAVVGMTKQMALDYAQDRIHVNALCPGFVESPMIQHFTDDAANKAQLASRHPWNSLGRPEDIADAALFLCSDESAWITGHSLVIDGAYTCG